MTHGLFDQPKIDLTGQRFGRLVIVHKIAREKQDYKGIMWKCLCDCGNICSARTGSLRTGSRISCGCRRKEVIEAFSKKKFIHGLCPAGNEHPLHNTWEKMKERCYSKKSVSWSYYGGRGITVCDRWLQNFGNFVEDMGPKPGPEYTIDRIDNDKGYYPKNCRWATRKTQALNQRKRKRHGRYNRKID